MPSLAQIALCAALAIATVTNALELDDYSLIDLTHTYDDETIYWPTSPSRFELETLAEGETDAGFYYSSYSICTPEHGGTHLDAPVHFAEGGMATDGG